MNKDTVVAIDLAKSVFQVCVMCNGKQVTNKRLRRSELASFVIRQKADRVAMEACYSSHYWARVFQQQGLEVRLIPAQHVKPFRRGNKNDRNDALAIAEAMHRPGLRFVPVKTVAQQDVQSLHRLRERWLKARLALTNQTRGLLSEYGVVFAQGNKAFREGMLQVLDGDDVSALLKEVLRDIWREYTFLERRLQGISRRIQHCAEQDANSQLLASIPGIGPVIATAITSSIGNGSAFTSAREFAVWTGLTPRQSSSGHKSVMLGISKRGDHYLRKQLVHGARATMRWCRPRDDEFSRWVNRLIARRGYNKAAVAVAHRLARLAWIILHKQERYAVKG